MILPSIDLRGGHAVQLVGGKEQKLDAGDPLIIADRFRLAGRIAIVDLDAALGTGDNAEVIRKLIRVAPCTLGGGIRSAEQALAWLDEGVDKVVLGTAARPEILSQLPKGRVIAALDAVDGEVVVDGWRERTGERIEERLEALKPYCSGFLVTFVEREGRLGGTALDRARSLRAAAGDDHELIIAGGVTTAEEIRALDREGIDAQVGMALYTGRLSLGDAIAAPLSSDRPDELWPTAVVDQDGVLLGLAYSNQESLREAVRLGRGVYHSRKRGLWIKGESSGATQELLQIALDCDRDTLRFTVRQQTPGFCHRDTWSCFGETGGLGALERITRARVQDAPEGSYTRRLLEDRELLQAKLLEEAQELAEAATQEEVAWEAADLIYFAAVAMARADVRFADVAEQLDRRRLRVRRRD